MDVILFVLTYRKKAVWKHVYLCMDKISASHKIIDGLLSIAFFSPETFVLGAFCVDLIGEYAVVSFILVVDYEIRTPITKALTLFGVV